MHLDRQITTAVCWPVSDFICTLLEKERWLATCCGTILQWLHALLPDVYTALLFDMAVWVQDRLLEASLHCAQVRQRMDVFTGSWGKHADVLTRQISTMADDEDKNRSRAALRNQELQR